MTLPYQRKALKSGTELQPKVATVIESISRLQNLATQKGVLTFRNPNIALECLVRKNILMSKIVACSPARIKSTRMKSQVEVL